MNVDCKYMVTPTLIHLLHNLPIKRKLLPVTQKQEQEFWIINKTALRNLYTVENNNS